ISCNFIDRQSGSGVFHVEDDLNANDDRFTDSSRLLSPLEASQLLTDEYSAKILLATYKRKISAQEISQRYGIPIAACYRKIRILEEVGLIQCVERILTQKGKRKNLYTLDESDLLEDPDLPEIGRAHV